MTLNNIKTKNRGFTIVELLIVIVIIAILAAITIVAYVGIQNRAKTSAAQALANNISKKAEAYNTINSHYPATMSDFQAGTAEAQLDSSSSASLQIIALSASQTKNNPSGAADTPDKSIAMQVCTQNGAAVGMILNWWSSTANAAQTMNLGTVTGSGVSCTYPNS